MGRILLLAAAMCAMNVAAALDTGKYDRSLELKAGHMKIHWKIEGDSLKLALEATATGWVGFGLGETTGMQGADVVYYEKASNTLTDAYVTDTNAMPVADKCQDWTLVGSETSGSKLIVELSRKLVPADTAQDRGITNDLAPNLPTPVIAAWGNTPTIGQHTTANRVGTTLRFFGAQSSSATDAALAALKAGGFSTHDFLVPNFPVPIQSSQPVPADASGTAYMEFCLNVPALGDASVAKHIVGFEAVLKNETRRYIHHYTLYGYGDGTASTPTYSTCPSSGDHGDKKREMVWMWAPGVAATKLPDVAGIRILGSEGIKAFVLQVHYDNPTFDTGKVDSSGFRIYYSTTLRANDAAVLEIGDPAVRAAQESNPNIPAGSSRVTFTHDAASCTNRFTDDSVTVFNRFLHMHEIGSHMTVTQKNTAGAVIRTDTADYYDFKQSGALAPKSTGAGYTISKGDTFAVECWYKNPGSTARRFGPGSTDEMCIDFIFYYPIQPGVAQCQPSTTTTGFPAAATVTSIPHDFASQAPVTCPAATTTPAPPPAATPTATQPLPKAPADTKHFVQIAVTMSYTEEEFKAPAVQTSFKKAVASAAGTVQENVEIVSFKPASRRNAGVVVQTKIRAKDAAAVTTMTSTLGSGDALKTKLNAALKKEGLKETTGVTAPVTGMSAGTARVTASMMLLPWALSALHCARVRAL